LKFIDGFRLNGKGTNNAWFIVDGNYIELILDVFRNVTGLYDSNASNVLIADIYYAPTEDHDRFLPVIWLYRNDTNILVSMYLTKPPVVILVEKYMGIPTPTLHDIEIPLDHAVKHGLSIIRERSRMRTLLNSIMICCILIALILTVYIVVSKFIKKRKLLP